MADVRHAKILEQLGKLIAKSEMLDPKSLNPPPDLTIDAFKTLHTGATALQVKTRDSRGEWRTAALDPATPDVDESEQNISASQQNSAMMIENFNELIDFLDAQVKHDVFIQAAAKLISDRISRNQTFYLNEGNICDRTCRSKIWSKANAPPPVRNTKPSTPSDSKNETVK